MPNIHGNWSATAEPTWLAAARADIGQRETLGPNDSPWIRTMLAKLGAKWLLGQPWCGGAVAKWVSDAGFVPVPKWWQARAWAAWGQPLDRPAHGCIVVFSRQGGGHVGFVVGEDAAGNLLVLGGNQGDAVNVRAFPRARVLAYRWPPGRELPRFVELAKGSAAATTGEA
jgi:uncharacterized protein (TIGR02594 family)